MTPTDLHQALAPLAAQIAGRPLDKALDTWLNAEAGPGSATDAAIKTACQQGVAEGWLCKREGGGIRYGRTRTRTRTHGLRSARRARTRRHP